MTSEEIAKRLYEALESAVFALDAIEINGKGDGLSLAAEGLGREALEIARQHGFGTQRRED